MVLSQLLAYAGWSILTIVVLVFIASSIVYIPNSKVGIKEKMWSGKGSVKTGILALQGEAGFEPEMLRGGFHFLIPFMYRIHRKDMVLVPQSEIAYIFARDGVSLPQGQALGSNTKANDFEDARNFLENQGNKGPQRKILREGSYPINLAQFVVLTKQRIYTLEMSSSDNDAITAMHTSIMEKKGFNPVVINAKDDTIGIVTIHDGPSLPSGELIAPIVGQVENHSKHNNYQEADIFINCDGYRGRQLQVLVDSTYYLNCLFATVEIVPKTTIGMGFVGVVIWYTGFHGKDLSGETYQHGELVGDYEKGVWQNALLPGKYPFNTYAGKAIDVPTTNFILKWESAESGSDFDRNLKEISLITKDAFEPTLPLSVVVHIDYRKAARVVQRFGDIQKLVEQTLDPMVSAYFKNIAQKKTIIELLQERSEIQAQALEEMKTKFEAYNLELQEVLIGTPRSSTADRQIETILTQLRDRQIAREQLDTYKCQEVAADTERSLRQAQAVAAQQKGLTESRIAIDIAENDGQALVKRQSREGEANAARITQIAEAEGNATKARGIGEAASIEAIGTATANAARQQVEAFGGPEVRLAQEIAGLITKAISDAKLQVVPNVVVGGDGKNANAMDAIAAMVLSGQQIGRDVASQALSNRQV